ncbi:hypothetical protein ACTQ44_10650, partial [Ligilactobacillus ruminis]|uniref:hypothetical protein n=1 Tax=Ligilactobacillus ruminis TaxID=1623 RepID=UPI003F9920B7
MAVPTINSCSFDITFQDPDYKTDYIKIQTDYKMNTNLKVHKLVHKLFLTKNGVIIFDEKRGEKNDRDDFKMESCLWKIWSSLSGEMVQG